MDHVLDEGLRIDQQTKKSVESVWLLILGSEKYRKRSSGSYTQGPRQISNCESVQCILLCFMRLYNLVL